MGVKMLTDADLEKIGKYVKSHIGIWTVRIPDGKYGKTL